MPWQISTRLYLETESKVSNKILTTLRLVDLPIGVDISDPGRLVDQPGGVNDDLDQSQCARDG